MRTTRGGLPATAIPRSVQYTAISEGVHPAFRGLCTPFPGRRYAGIRGWIRSRTVQPVVSRYPAHVTKVQLQKVPAIVTRHVEKCLEEGVMYIWLKCIVSFLDNEDVI